MISKEISMFKILDDPLVQLMLALSAEKRPEQEKLKRELKETDLSKLLALCVTHELEGIVASHILEDGLMELPQDWLTAYTEQKTRQTYLKEKAEEVCRVMRENGIPMVILKNGGIMVDMVEDPAACPMEDIDSLVCKKDFKAAHELLKQMGFTFKFRSEFEKEELGSAYRDGSTEYYFMSPDGEKRWFELSWRPVAGRWIRQDLEPDTDELMQRSQFAPNSDVRVLSPEDNLLQVCIHTAKHSYVRAPGLRLHLDVERILAYREIDWKVFLARVKKTHVCNSVFYSLWIPSVLFGSPVPEWVLKELMPSKHKHRTICEALGRAGLLEPQKKKFSKVEFLRFQTALYDSLGDMLKVLYPGADWMKERYGYSNALLIPAYILIRLLDLVGIRKRK